MNNNYIVIHGSYGSPFINWFSWLYKKLSEMDKSVIVPQFPIGQKQCYKNWSTLLKYYFDLGFINEKTIIIGHSIAPIFIIKFLLDNKIKISKLIFVSGFNNAKVNSEYDEVNKSFFTDNIERIHEYCKDIICLYSDNDPYVKQADLKLFADSVADKQVVIQNGGHLNSESGYDEFNELFKYL